ncbi:MAG: hypothetical protein ACM3U2_15265 [Deltaproteobacteria bacterium]
MSTATATEHDGWRTLSEWTAAIAGGRVGWLQRRGAVPPTANGLHTWISSPMKRALENALVSSVKPDDDLRTQADHAPELHLLRSSSARIQ